MVLITNRQSNILQDIDSLHLFAQVATSICKSLDEREILRNAYELLSAFDELVTLGYRENLSLGQIKTFLEMESHEERIQEIISRVCYTHLSLLELSSILMFSYRIRSWKLQRSGKEKQSSLNYSGKRWLGVVEVLPLGRHRTRHILRLLGLRVPTRMIAMKRKKISLSSASLLFTIRWTCTDGVKNNGSERQRYATWEEIENDRYV